MKLLWTSLIIPSLLVASCSNEPAPSTAEHASVTQGDAAVTMPSEAHQTPAASGELTGTVVETMDSGGYTYVLVDNSGEEVWAAVPQTSVKVGDQVTLGDLMAMPGFHSSTLERDFEMIYFSSGIAGSSDAQAAISAAHGAMGALDPKEAAAPAEVEKLAGGLTVAEVFERKAELVGKEVALRGQVVKYTAEILGKNWIHIQDGSGAEGTNDLTITTDATAAVGDIVVVRGVLAADKDFGYGYKYAEIIEDAEVTVE